MHTPTTLRQLFRVDDRFRRSANVATDYQHEGALNGYVVTPLVRAILSRLSAGLGKNALNRAWSITGPYGAGKSACAVLLCQVLGYPVNEAARRLLRQEDPSTEHELLLHVPELASSGFFMVPIVGSRQPMAGTLLGGLLEALAAPAKLSSRLDRHREWLLSLHQSTRTAASVSSNDVVQAIERTAQLVCAEMPDVLGLILVYDELGKSLEYATLNPEHSDVGLLQTLAERVSRSQDPPIALVTILHQAFEHYAAFLGPLQRREWEKVQGRFQDIPFQRSSGELLSLLQRAIRPLEGGNGLRPTIELEVRRAAELTLLPRDLDRDSARRVLMGCAPLHPTVALVLGKLFRSRLAQNERSLFAFLSSGEPHGFQDYLHTEFWEANGYRPFYRLDRLHDYVQAALGSGLYAQAQGKRWAEIEDALERLPADADPLDARLVKTIGMLALLGDQVYLRASPEVLCYALADGRTTDADVTSSLERLQELNIALYRSFMDAYGLWQGSDIDLDECYKRGLAQGEAFDLAAALNQSGQLKPYVAKRHLHETGTFRHFELRAADLECIGAVVDELLHDADGAVIFVLPPASMPLKEAVQRVRAFSSSLSACSREQCFFALPRHVQGLREGLEELAAWQWVTENIAELEGDSIARRELKARQLAARERLGRAIFRCFDLSSAYASSLWVQQGEVRQFTSARQLASALSDACNSVFRDAPIVRNELINRQSLSSAAAAARRNLLEGMLDRGAEERLGLEGYPPEASIYLSVLEASGLHHQEAGGWAFGPPAGEDECRVGPLWAAIDEFLTKTEAGPRPITNLYRTLSQPPLGIREGLLPIYLTAALLHWSSEVAFYEEGTFVPEVGIAEIERLLRVPERFALQRYRLSDTRMRLLTGYARLFNPDVEPGQVTVLGNVRRLMVFARRLPRYTQLTDRLSGDAQAVRHALYSAKEPQTLLFSLLPGALGFESLADDAAVDGYLGRLRAALLELQRAYDGLLEAIESELLSALRLPAQVAMARREVEQRASLVQDYVTDTRLRAFLFRLRDDGLGEREWIESVAAMVVAKPPRSWGDADAQAFDVEIAGLCDRLRRIEEVALSKGDAPPENRVLRLSVTDESGRERRDLLRVRPETEPELDRALQAIERALRDLELDAETGLTALALLAQRMLGRLATPGEERHD